VIALEHPALCLKKPLSDASGLLVWNKYQPYMKKHLAASSLIFQQAFDTLDESLPLRFVVVECKPTQLNQGE
jgi:hypothetical protein